jgi:hypothetical protein
VVDVPETIILTVRIEITMIIQTGRIVNTMIDHPMIADRITRIEDKMETLPFKLETSRAHSNGPSFQVIANKIGLQEIINSTMSVLQ